MINRCIAIILCCMGMINSSAYADGITLFGSPIQLRSLTIRTIQDGRINMFDANNRPFSQALNEIDTINFDDLKEMDQAEKEFAKGNYSVATEHYLIAALKTKTKVHRIWVHQRLAQSHNYQGQYIQAAGHAATVFVLQDDLYWRRLIPRGDVDQPSYEAAAETMQILSQAARKVQMPQLNRAVAEMIAIIQPVFEKLKASHKGAPYKPNSTISGIEKSQIGKQPIQATKPQQKPIRKPTQDKPPVSTPDDKTASPIKPSTPVPGESNKSTSPSTIDNLLAANKALDAVELCKQIAEIPGDRELDRFLHQYGMALKGADKKPQAAIMFLQCALSFPGSQYSASSLIETALIYETVYKKPQTSIRLLERAVVIATSQKQADKATHARRELAKLRL